ncbi:hypothetical protein ACFOKI_08800 [Sphingomonas qilianensis]|uniref:Uncharacterized protein n=1 Tax=Sphingomonas qilianensis TaxID=1736690 RepID=A0ABU9XTV5_9SPHN
MNDTSAEARLVAAVPSSLKPDAHGQPGEPDAHGQAALLLAESILHALVESKTLSVDTALSVIETACEVKTEMAALSDESRGRMRESLELLRAISGSFSIDAR